MTQLCLAPPVIRKYLPSQSGVDNAGIGITSHGERFLLKTQPDVCLAEFVGASLCRAAGIPSGEPWVVDFKQRHVFGSRLESGVELPQSNTDLLHLLTHCGNATIFSAVLALDLALGNDDRHWHNWLYQVQPTGEVFLRVIDFSRAWPTAHPPHTFAAIHGRNTHESWRMWAQLGVTYDSTSAEEMCDFLHSVGPEWLGNLFEQLPVEWHVTSSGPELCEWWAQHWQTRVSGVRTFLQSGAWT